MGILRRLSFVVLVALLVGPLHAAEAQTTTSKTARTEGVAQIGPASIHRESAAADNLGVISFTLGSTKTETLKKLTVAWTGAAADPSTDIFRATLFRESGSIGGSTFDPSADLFMAQTSATSSPKFVLDPADFTFSEAKFYIAVDVRPDAPVGDTIDFAVAANAIVLRSGKWPPAKQVKAGTWNPTGATTVADAAPDLRVSMTSSSAVVTIGQTYDNDITITNAAPVVAEEVTIDDPVPAKASVQTVSASFGTTCTVSGQDVQCSSPTLAINDEIHVRITARAEGYGLAANTATATSANGDVEPSDNAASVQQLFVRGDVDLALTIADSADPTTDGANLTYTLHVSNRGPAGAADVSVTQRLPSAVDFVSAPQGCEFIATKQTVACSVRYVGPSSSIDRTIVVRAKSPGTIGTEATVSSPDNETNPSDNSDLETTVVIAGADLGLTDTDSPDPVNEGNSLTYTLGVHNYGPDVAHGVVVTERLPSSVSFVEADAGCIYDGVRNLVCRMDGDLANADDVDFHITVTPNSVGEIVDGAAVSSPGTADPDSTNNSKQAQTTVVERSADLAVTTTDSRDPVNPEEPYSYEVLVTNHGPSPAQNVNVHEVVDESVDIVDVPAGPCSLTDAHTVDCSLGTVASDGQTSFDFGVVPHEEKTVTAKATVSSDTADANPANDVSDEETVVRAADVDLDVTQTDSPDPANGTSDVITYSVTVRNFGPDTADAAVLTDVIPTGATFISASGDCTYTVSVATLDCRLGDLTSGDAVTVDVVVRPPRARVIILNRVHVSSYGTDADPSDDSSTEPTQVT